MTENSTRNPDLLAEYDHWSVHLHQNQSFLGRGIIALNRGADDQEMDPFDDTTEAEFEEFLTIRRGLVVALNQLYQPTRINYANLRNHWKRCHWHVVPRYADEDMGLRVVAGFEFHDLNPGGSFLPSPEVDVPSEIFEQVRSDVADGLANAIR